MITSISSIRRPRVAFGTWQARNSRSSQPTPAPNTSRPPDSTSRFANALAVTTGSRTGSTRMPVPTVTRRVAGMTVASVVTGSRNTTR